VRKEVFDTSRPVAKKEPPDKEVHNVFIHFKGNSYQFSVQYPQTILQAAKQNNITLPYSCETGMCGSCMMYCKTGKVWMSHNEVLTEKDTIEGKVLTCTGHPVFGNVILEL